MIGVPIGTRLAEDGSMHAADVLCFSHLRWNFVFQRPNHLMTRCARNRRVIFIEEPEIGAAVPQLEMRNVQPNLLRVVPQLPPATEEEHDAMLRTLFESLNRSDGQPPIHWFYTPMMFPLVDHLPSSLTVYDCMDQLSHFLYAHPDIVENERRLLERAHVVFTGGRALYDAKKAQHANVHAVPSSVDVPFFATARAQQVEPNDQASIASPRIGYCGVIDERIDLELIAHIARERPDWQIVLLGPTAKVEPEALPQLPNIHYLGLKPYAELPAYIAGWQAAIMPFALNEATRFISPTKTPEYLAAGKPVVSTAIADVVEPYERLGFVRIGRDRAEFVHALDESLRGKQRASADERDAFLARMSWDATWSFMETQLERAALARTLAPIAPEERESTVCSTT
jgi:glycosyltransferase involved in cell wall biosynthesis